VAPHSAARCARVLRQLPPSREQEGAGKAGCTLHPAVSCAKLHKNAHTSIQVQRRHPAFPAQWFTAYSALSPVNGLSCHRRPRDTALDPFGSMRNRELDASIGASGPHDFAGPRQPRSFSRSFRVHRIPPRVRDDRDPPLSSGETTAELNH